MEYERNQVMSAYFKASQLIAGCHLSQFYIKLEYSPTNNTHLAEKFFSQVLEVALFDLFVVNKLCVTAFSSGHYERAEKYLSDALLRVESVSRSGLSSSISDKKESLLNNLGHTDRKLGRYQMFISFHQQALVFSPLNPSTYSALGHVKTLIRHLTNVFLSLESTLVNQSIYS